MLALAACTSSADDADTSGSGSSTDDITSVDQSAVKRQSIGNCWIYAVSSWLEALEKGATNQELNTSESWLTFWHWYEQLANGSVGTEVETGGGYDTAAEIINRYGIMLEKDFIPEEATDELSMRQSNSLDAVNAQLKNGGPLKDAVTSKDRTKILSALMDAWQLDPDVRTHITTVFGAGVTKTLDKSYVNAAPGNTVIRAKDFPARLVDFTTHQASNVTLQDAIGERSGFSRTGQWAWAGATYPSDDTGRRKFQERVQRALADSMPVLISWHVDFNALTPDSHFSLKQLQMLGPGRQGGHMTVLHDYEAANVPGFGTLAAGTDATPDQLQAALSDQTQIVFLRVKNSWGGIRPDRWNASAIPGYHDLDMDYMNAEITECDETEPGVNPTPDMCHGKVTPWQDVTLPAGY
ncbi:MAG TPA: hypothetical protein VIF62_13490 [Labilithrix sp.]